MIPAREALERLQEGNRRYMAGEGTRASGASPARRAELLEAQQPFAVILGCSDSRVPAEIVFDQGPGDLFIVRVAGNTAGPSQIGSIEYAVSQLGTRLVVVLGHSRCGAVQATVDDTGAAPSPHLRAILDRVRPAVDAVRAAGVSDPTALLREAVRANVRATVDRLRTESAVLSGEPQDALVVGAEYSLESGTVDFFPDGQA